MPNTAMIEQRLRFLEIDQVVIDNLHSARQILEPELDRMLDAFYAHIADEPQLENLFPDEESMLRARDAQKSHWIKSLLAGDFTTDHFDRAQRVGRAHARVGLTPSWYIGGYSTMLAKFIERILAQAAEGNYNASPIIEALCKAVLLDVDLVIDSYLEAKDRVIFDLLMHATLFIDELVETNEEVRVVSDKVRVSAESLLQEAGEDGDSVEQLKELLAHATLLTNNAQRLDARIDELKSGERLYLQSGSDHTGTFSQLVSQIIDD